MKTKDLQTTGDILPEKSIEEADGGIQQAPAVNEPDTQTSPQWCRKCKADVIPRGKGLCPRCGIFLRQNFVARRTAVNVLRRDALLAKLLAEFPPANLLERITCERLASAMEQLEVTKPGSMDWQRLVQAEQTLSAVLQDAKRARQADVPSNLQSLTPDKLVDRIAGLLTTAIGLRDAKPTPIDVIDAGLSVPASPAVTTAPAPQPELKCTFCYGTPSGCSKLKATHFELWRLLHTRDPLEIERRNAEATKQMMNRIGQPNRSEI
jgi:hypothetical protein